MSNKKQRKHPKILLSIKQWMTR